MVCKPTGAGFRGEDVGRNGGRSKYGIVCVPRPAPLEEPGLGGHLPAVEGGSDRRAKEERRSESWWLGCERGLGLGRSLETPYTDGVCGLRIVQAEV